MRQSLPRVPKDRIAVIIGAKGETARAIKKAAGCKEFNIDSDSGDLEVLWGAAGTYDPVKAMKLPDVVKAIGRGMAPNAAVTLLEDDHFFELVDLRDFVGKRSNQQRRIRARIIGREGKIRKLIENLTQTQISIYNSTVVLVGEEGGLYSARHAIEMLAGGSEHGSVISFLERDRKRARLESKSLDAFEEREDTQRPASGFDSLVPGLAEISESRNNRRMRAAQVDPEDGNAVSEMMELAEDETVNWEEE
ncbi:MAG: KH domain-containing protein [Candidatus Poseidonia sp.]|uniref:KH domain-containing protein n=1 Tax=Poseidonia sp. TaxID=2666344 RepID=UPI0030C520C9|nr:KH domain-containing protein [Poseidonia sp.]